MNTDTPQNHLCAAAQPIDQSRSETGFPKGQKVTWIVLSRIEAMITGVWRIQRAHDLTVLTYTDNTIEAASVPLKRWQEIQSNVFSIVGEVQLIARRKASQSTPTMQDTAQGKP